jgi:hypothetical protein
MLGPLALLALAFSRKKSRGKWDNLVILLVLGLAVGLSLSACGVGEGAGMASETHDNITATVFWQAPNSDGSVRVALTVTARIPGENGAPAETVIFRCRGTLTPSPTPQKIEDVNLSAYYTVLEADYLGGKVPIKANTTKKQQIGADYLLKGVLHAYTNYEQSAQTARSDFLYDQAGLCMQGSGKLEENDLYISCTDPVGNIPNVGFEWHSRVDEVTALETVAICPRDHLTPFRQGDVIQIPALKTYMQSKGKDEFFTVTDTGGGLCKTDGHSETLDVYLGDGYNSTREDYYYVRNFNSTTVFIHRNTTPQE